MNEVISWGVSPTKRRSTKTEESTLPLLTFRAIEDKKGAGRKMTFNKAAQALMDISGENNVALGYAEDGTGRVFVRKAESNEGIKLTKSCSFSNRKAFDAITEIKNLDTSVENQLKLVALPEGNIFELVSSTEEFSLDEIEVTRTETPIDSEASEFETSIQETVENSTDAENTIIEDKSSTEEGW